MNRFLAVSVTAFTLALAAPASASLLGDTVQLDVSTDLLGPIDSDVFVVGPGAEVDVGGFGTIFYDAQASSLLITIAVDDAIGFNPGDVMHFVLTGIDATVAGVTFDHASATGFLGTTFSFTPHSVTIDWPSQPVSQGDEYEVNLEFQQVVAAPEPASLAILGASMVAMGLLRRRRAA
jgi:hypothetical protein